jgi:hypothetical protein
MYRFICTTLAALATMTLAQADEKAEARALVEKAIKAMGGKEKLAVDKGIMFKAKGKFYGMGGDGIDYTSDFTIQPPDMMRFRMEFDAGGTKINFARVFDGKKFWQKVNDMVTELGKDEVTEQKEDMHNGRVEALVPLLEDKGFELATVGEVKVDDKPAVGIRVSHKGHRDVNLFFDTKTGLLVKSERMIKDQMQGGKERTQERLFSDYKEAAGAKRPMKVVIKRDGDKFVESEATEYELKDKIDASEFAKP